MAHAQGKDIFAKLGNAKFLTMLDLRSGYHHIALDDDAIRKTAFVIQTCKGPIWLSSSTCILSNYYNKVLNGLHFTFAYLDDVIIFNELAEQHLKHIPKVLTRLKQAKL